MTRNRNKQKKLNLEFGSEEMKNELCNKLNVKPLPKEQDKVNENSVYIEDVLPLKQVLARL